MTKDYAIPVGIVLALVGIFLSWQSQASQSRSNSEVLSLEREILQLERDIIAQQNLHSATMINAVENMSTAVTTAVNDLVNATEGLRDDMQDMRDEMERDRNDSSDRFRELVAWVRADCYASANGSSESREHCSEVDRLGR